MATGPDRHGALRSGADVTSDGGNQLSNPSGVFVNGDTTMPRQTRSRTPIAARPVESPVLRFVSRAEQLQVRGRRNFDRYMRVIKKYVAADGPRSAQWQKESAEDAMWDAEWNKRHGPVPGGARILHWRHEGEQRSRLLTSSDASIR
jgi:hypothetical protein